MIAIETGLALSRLLDRMTSRPDLYSEVFLCSPFIDAAVAKRLGRLIDAARRSRCGVTIITTRKGSEILRRAATNSAPPRTVKIRARRNLHAKAYLALGRGTASRLSEAFVTSANLTIAAFSRNEELGIHVVTHSDASRALFAQIHHSLRQLAA